MAEEVTVDAPLPSTSPMNDMDDTERPAVFPLEANYLQEMHNAPPGAVGDSDEAVQAPDLVPPTSPPSQNQHVGGRDPAAGRPLQRLSDTTTSSATNDSSSSKALWVQQHAIEPLGQPTGPLNPSNSHLPRHDTVKKTAPDVPLSSPTKPTAPARPARPRAPTVAAAATTAMRNPDITSDDPLDSSTAIVTFDVGGTIFRCKQRVVEKHPNKRLHRLLLCGCEQQRTSAAACSSMSAPIFVDRNPSYFALILDWYRTGTFHVPDSLTATGLQQEAAYFDVLAEMFPHNDDTATRGAATSSASLPIKAAALAATSPISASPPLPPPSSPPPSFARPEPSSTAIHCFVKSYALTLVPSQPPVVFVLRSHEQLVLESAAGVGRLLLRVTDLHGATTVPHAVLYDSHSYFFLGGGQAKLHGTPFPGNLIYSFWADDSAAPPPYPSGSSDGATMPLHVEFKLRCAFSASEELALAPDAQQLLSHTLDMVAKSTSATVTTAVLAGLDLEHQSSSPRASDRRAAERPKQSPVVATTTQPPQPALAPGPTLATTTACVVANPSNDRFASVAPVTGYRAPAPAAPPAVLFGAVKENAATLPEKTKERAQILDEAQQFQTKVKEHAAWLQHYQREIQQSGAIPRDLPPHDLSSPTKKVSTGAASVSTVATPRPVVKRK